MTTGEKILLAEDDVGMRELLAEFLQEVGYEVATAKDGREALQAMEGEEFSLALLDLRLPDVSGLEILSALKSRFPDTQVILFTGYGDLKSAIQALRLGASDYLLKSDLILAELQAVVERALERRRLTRENLDLTAHLSLAQEELVRRRAAELKQIRTIGETLAGASTWEKIFHGLLDLIWDGLPLAVMGIRFLGGDWPLENFRRRPEVSEPVFRNFQDWFNRLLLAETENPAPPQTLSAAGESPLPAMLWETGRAGEVTALVAAGREVPFTPEEAELFRIFLLQGEAALNHLMLLEEIRTLAIRDGLTGLYNYRQFWELLNLEVGKSRRYGHPLSLLFMDIDDFKNINDTMGHPQGDLVLKTLGGYLQTGLRQVDVVCRYGGEEFAALLTQTPLEMSIVLAERLRRGVAGLSFPFEGRTMSITVSIGVAELQPGMNGEDLVKAADDALYRAKRQGKNRVCGVEAE